MAEFINLVTNGIVSQVLLGYIFVLWISLIFWTGTDIFSRSENWFFRLGSVFLVGIGFIFGFALYVIIRPPATIEEAKTRGLEEKILESQSKSFACPSCGELVREDFMFCASCGTRVKRECSTCKRSLEIVWSQCPYCGTPALAVLPTIKEVPALSGKENGSLINMFRKIFSNPETPVDIKRGRGRPRKVVVGPIVKRPRGRPRKYELNAISTKDKRGRGRPKKEVRATP